MPEHPPARSPTGPLLLIAAILILLLVAFAWAAGLIGHRRVSGGSIADALQTNGGLFPGYRRAHAKGLCLSGHFDANGDGAALASAPMLKAGTYQVLGRFSLGGGNPLATDGRNIFHSMALRIGAPGGEQWRMAMDHTPIFPVADPQAFMALLKATTPDPKTGKPDPALIQAYMARHPETKAFQAYLDQAVLPDSFANATYYSINAFRFTDGAGATRNVRWQMVPDAPLSGLDKAKLDALPKNYLFDEMIARSAKAPSRWHLQLIVANPGDVTNKATVAWTGAHRTIDAGTLTVDTVAPEETGGCRDLNFDPTILPRGIALSDDPLLAARSKAYSTSFYRRGGEKPGPSAAGQDLHAGSKPQ
jgi:catalase